MKKSPSNKFWTGGMGEYLKALQEEEQERLSLLRVALKSETDPDRKRDLENQIKEVQTEYKKKRKAAGSSLFLGR